MGCERPDCNSSLRRHVTYEIPSTYLVATTKSGKANQTRDYFCHSQGLFTNKGIHLDTYLGIKIKTHFRSLLLPNNQISVQGDGVAGATLAGDYVVDGEMLVELLYECLSDSGEVLIEGVAQRVDDLGYGEVEPGLVGTGAQLPVDVEQLGVIVLHVLVDDAFGIAQVEEIDGFGQGTHLDFHTVVVGQKDAIIGGDNHARQGFLLVDELVDGHE